MNTPTDPIPEFKLRTGRDERREPVSSRARGPSQAPDAETLEVVQKFEALYAELAAATPPTRPLAEDLTAGDLQFAFPDGDLRQREPAASGVPAHEGDAGRRADAAAQPAAAPAIAGPAEKNQALEIDEAFSILRAAESQGRAAERHAVDEAVASAPVTERGSLRPLRWPDDHRRAPTARGAAPAGADWSGRARDLWPRVVGAAVIALIVGTGVGYIAGKGTPPGGTQAKIPVTPQGGAQLQFDYELEKR